MARVAQTKYEIFDDMDGKPLEPDTKPLKYQVQGKTYNLFLSPKNEEKFLSFINDVLDGAEVTSGAKGQRNAAGSPSKAKEIRAWAADKGIDVPSRGRIPRDVQEQYEAAQ